MSRMTFESFYVFWVSYQLSKLQLKTLLHFFLSSWVPNMPPDVEFRKYYCFLLVSFYNLFLFNWLCDKISKEPLNFYDTLSELSLWLTYWIVWTREWSVLALLFVSEIRCGHFFFEKRWLVVDTTNLWYNMIEIQSWCDCMLIYFKLS